MEPAQPAVLPCAGERFRRGKGSLWLPLGALQRAGVHPRHLAIAHRMATSPLTRCSMISPATVSGACAPAGPSCAREPPAGIPAGRRSPLAAQVERAAEVSSFPRGRDDRWPGREGALVRAVVADVQRPARNRPAPQAVQDGRLVGGALRQEVEGFLPADHAHGARVARPPREWRRAPGPVGRARSGWRGILPCPRWRPRGFRRAGRAAARASRGPPGSAARSAPDRRGTSSHRVPDGHAAVQQLLDSLVVAALHRLASPLRAPRTASSARIWTSCSNQLRPWR